MAAAECEPRGPVLAVHAVTTVGQSAWGDYKTHHNLSAGQKDVFVRMTGSAPAVDAYCTAWLEKNRADWEEKGMVPAAELESLAALAAEVIHESPEAAGAPIDMVLHLLVNESDPEHLAYAVVIEAFLPHLAALIAPGLNLAARDVRISLERIDVAAPSRTTDADTGIDLGRLSVLDGNLETLANASIPEADVNRAQQTFTSVVMALFEELQSGSADGRHIYACTKSGSIMARGMLETLAVTWGIRSTRGVKTVMTGRKRKLTRPGGQEFSHLAASRSHVRRAFSRAVAVMALADESMETAIYREKLGLFLDVETANGELGPLCRLSDAGKVLARRNLPEDNLLDSACAGVLERAGQPGGTERALQLRRLVRLWSDNQLWAVNGVPELVLHGAGHGEAVDRNLANVCAPLLEKGRLTVEDVFTLACTAWLHDWGHTPAHPDKAAPTSPNEIRDLHGLLTQRRLAGQDHRDLHGLPPDVAARVGAIAAHHQGWTSCSEQPPDAVLARNSAARYNIRACSFAEELAQLTQTMTGEGAGTQTGGKATATPYQDPDSAAEPQRNQLLLALFRICDATDVGVHRVPDANVLPSKLVDLWLAELADKYAPSHRGSDVDRAAVRDILDKTFGEARDYLVEYADSPEKWSADKTERLFADIAKAQESAAPSAFVTAELQHLRIRLETLRAQYTYYERHRRVWLTCLAVRPSTETGFDFDIVPYVLNNPFPPPEKSGSLALDKSRSDDEQAHHGVSLDMYREIGQDFITSVAGKGPGTPKDAEDAKSRAKHPIGQYLQRAGLRLAPAELIDAPVLTPTPVRSTSLDNAAHYPDLAGAWTGQS